METVYVVLRQMIWAMRFRSNFAPYEAARLFYSKLWSDLSRWRRRITFASSLLRSTGAGGERCSREPPRFPFIRPDRVTVEPIERDGVASGARIDDPADCDRGRLRRLLVGKLVFADFLQGLRITCVDQCERAVTRSELIVVHLGPITWSDLDRECLRVTKQRQGAGENYCAGI
jgi:hypothetical protein